ncbi:hypothetical protein TURU_004643 [Turdus rufiventris]|nr:hypothetical protein TURU_004643 [Turdus rufiventris]
MPDRSKEGIIYTLPCKLQQSSLMPTQVFLQHGSPFQSVHLISERLWGDVNLLLGFWDVSRDPQLFKDYGEQPHNDPSQLSNTLESILQGPIDLQEPVPQPTLSLDNVTPRNDQLPYHLPNHSRPSASTSPAEQSDCDHHAVHGRHPDRHAINKPSRPASVNHLQDLKDKWFRNSECKNKKGTMHNLPRNGNLKLLHNPSPDTKIRRDIKMLHDMQQLVGSLQRLCNIVLIPPKVMDPLNDLLKGKSPWEQKTLTSEAISSVNFIEHQMSVSTLTR